MKSKLTLIPIAALALAALPALAQVVGKDTVEPVQVLKGKGEFAAKLNGAMMPAGKGWKPVMDARKRVQVTLPDRWKVEVPEGDDAIIRAIPPGQEKQPSAVFMVLIASPGDNDPLQVEEKFALNYADELAEEPSLKALQFKPTDSGYVIARGMKFALAGGTMTPKKSETFRQEQLVFIGEDRVVTLQFTAREKDFSRYLDDLAKIFASYQTIGVRRLDVE
ncbi:MAG TPA: hypothetical protein VFU47_11575 [Armatimonadota bacterium]|nr:hypothetical protein [Armatimonadota bacterium]